MYSYWNEIWGISFLQFHKWHFWSSHVTYEFHSETIMCFWHEFTFLTFSPYRIMTKGRTMVTVHGALYKVCFMSCFNKIKYNIISFIQPSNSLLSLSSLSCPFTKTVYGSTDSDFFNEFICKVSCSCFRLLCSIHSLKSSIFKWKKCIETWDFWSW